jgi:hypothetical protein
LSAHGVPWPFFGDKRGRKHGHGTPWPYDFVDFA